MSKRPSIDNEIVRKLLIECGHRCAVCGESTPLELAHIIPWRESREHKVEDLICLCANCHGRADKEKWGEKQLRKHKEKPWVFQQHGKANNITGPKIKLKLKIDMEIEYFDDRAQKRLRNAITEFLKIPQDTIRITSIEKGSVKITIELPLESAEKLLSAYEKNDSMLVEYLAPLVLLDICQETSTLANMGGLKMPFELPKTRVLEELADYVVSYLDKEFKGDGCSFFMKEEGSLGRFRLIATTKLTRFIGIETKDAYDKEAMEKLGKDEEIKRKSKETLKGFGLTKYSIRLAISYGEGLLSEEVEKDPLWSAQNYEIEKRDRRCENMYCEVTASELLSYMAVPLLFKSSSPTNYNPLGLIRILRAKKSEEGYNKLPFTLNEFEEFEKEIKKITPFFETSVSISYLAALGNATIQTGKFWDEVITKLRSIVAGTEASVFELEETGEDIVKYVCKASTGLYDRNGNKIDIDTINRREIYYEEKLNEKPRSLTTWAAKYRGNVIIKRTHDKEEFEEYYSNGLNRDRGPGRGQYSEHPDDISIIMVPIMSLDNRRADAIIRIAKERKLGEDSRFTDDQIKLFLSIVPAISKIFVTARRLELLESLSSRSIENRDHLYNKVVNTVPKLIGAPGCTLLVSRDENLSGVASSASHIQKKIKEGTFAPYNFGQGYTGFVAGKNKYLLLNDRKEADRNGIEWSGREYECEVGEKIRTCDRFLAVPVHSYLGKEVIGVIRTAKMLYHDPFSEIDRILLEVFADRLSLTIEEIEREHRGLEEQRKRIEDIFSKFLVDECKHLGQVKCKGDIRSFFYDLETPKSDIRTVTLEKISLLWKKFLKISFEVGNQLYQFENNILGKVPGYRDHFLHQFQVFLVGIYIIDRLIYFKSSANSLSEKEEEDWEKLEKGWILTANFHDMASTIALIGKWLPKVVGVLLKEAKDIIGPSQFSKIVHDPQQNYYVYLEKMGEILERKEKPKLNFMKESLVRLEKGDHGLLSALSLLGNIPGRTEDMINEAGLAIALHTMALADEERKLSKIEIGHIIFDELPLVFLLLYCDNLHEWGRDLSGMVSNKDNSFDPKNFNIIVTKKIPNILLKNKELKRKIEKIGNSSNIIYVHTEIFVDEVDKLGFENKKQRLTQLFNVIESDNPLFSVHLNKSFLYDSLTQTLIDTRPDT